MTIQDSWIVRFPIVPSQESSIFLFSGRSDSFQSAAVVFHCCFKGPASPATDTLHCATITGNRRTP